MFATLSSPTWLGGPTTDAEAVSLITSTLFPSSYLDQPAASSSSSSSTSGSTQTNREVVEREMLNRARVTRLQTGAGRIGQMAAALSHHVTEEQCRLIGESLPRVLIITGSVVRFLIASLS